MIELLPFTQADFATLKSWIRSPEELFQFSGPLFQFPLTDQQLEKHLTMKEYKPFKVVLTSTRETVGHCEMNFEHGNHRLSRILVGKEEMRGQKIGEHIVRELVKRFFLDPDIREVDLNTFDWNIAAIRCYEKVGFKINPIKREKMSVNGHEWTRINMILKRD